MNVTYVVNKTTKEPIKTEVLTIKKTFNKALGYLSDLIYKLKCDNIDTNENVDTLPDGKYVYKLSQPEYKFIVYNIETATDRGYIYNSYTKTIKTTYYTINKFKYDYFLNPISNKMRYDLTDELRKKIKNRRINMTESDTETEFDTDSEFSTDTESNSEGSITTI